MFSRRSSNCVRLAVALLAGASALLAGCVSADAVSSAQESMERALRVEQPAAFFVPVQARARGETAPNNLTPQARQHYLAIIADLQVLMPGDKEDLRRQGLLGDALVLRTLAQWRLGRIDEARKTALEARTAGQEPLNARDRTMLAAFEGVSQLEAAIVAAKAGATYEKLFELIRGEAGVWRTLGLARGEAARTNDQPVAALMETRLAAFKVLKDAHDRRPVGTPVPPDGDDGWDRARAEAQVELGEFAALAATEPAEATAARAARVKQWAGWCGLEAPAR